MDFTKVHFSKDPLNGICFKTKLGNLPGNIDAELSRYVLNEWPKISDVFTLHAGCKNPANLRPLAHVAVNHQEDFSIPYSAYIISRMIVAIRPRGGLYSHLQELTQQREALTVRGRDPRGLPKDNDDASADEEEKSETLRVITKKLKCIVAGCKKVVKSKSALEGHLRTAHKIKRYRCLVGPCYGKVATSFTTQDQLNNHLDLEHGRPTSWACYCSKKFSNYHSLCTHFWKYHEIGHFVCSKDGCNVKSKSTRSKVQAHQASHRVAKYGCPIEGCDFKSKHKGTRDSHFLTHAGQRPFNCTECGKSFSRKGNLKRHALQSCKPTEEDWSESSSPSLRHVH